MNLLNLACGAVRVVDDTWINVDNLHETLLPGTPERANLDAEPNYVNADITRSLPFVDGMFDGVLASHCIEHFDCQQGVAIMRECHRILKPGGVLVVSVPDIEIFHQHEHEDTVENAERLFGEPIYLPDGETTFCGYAAWNRYHKTIMCPSVLKAYFERAGFLRRERFRMETAGQWHGTVAANIFPLLNRLSFSLVVVGTK